MKKRIFICLAGTALALTLINPAFSQKTNKVLSNESLLSSQEVPSPFPDVSSGYINDISPRVIRDFIKRFDYIPGGKWSKVTNGYIAFFEKDDIKFKISYDNKGYWVNTMRTYTEKYLPFAVRHPVKSTYYDFNIYKVTEIESDDQPLIYLIYLRKADDESSLKDIMYSDGEMQEMEQSKGKWKKKSF